jgi:hypothetical protein
MMQLLKRKPKEIKVSESVKNKLFVMTDLTDDQLRDKLIRLYHSPYAAKNRSDITGVPCEEWVERQMELRKVRVR